LAHAYLAEFHTAEHMRSEFFFPTIANREKRAVYRADDTALARAKAFVADLRAKEPAHHIEGGVRQKILDDFPEIVR